MSKERRVNDDLGVGVGETRPDLECLVTGVLCMHHCWLLMT